VAVLEKERMMELAESATNKALKKGANDAEALVYEGKATSIGIERGQITKNSRIIDRGLGLRVTLNKAMGFAYTNVIETEATIDETVLKAINAAKASKPDVYWKGFPSKKMYNSPEKTFDTRILDLRAENLVDMASRMMDSAVAGSSKIFPIEGGAGASYVAEAIANSNGIANFDKGTMVECSLATLAQEGKKVTPVCFEFNAERSLNVDPEWVGKEAARLASSALNTKRIETKDRKLILTQFALQELLSFTLINAIRADSVQRGQSPFENKIGQKVAAENVTIHDDGLLEGGLRTSICDGEGVPHQKTVVIEQGILKNFIYDNYTSKREGKESTGNASRAGYLSTPSIDATNFHLLPGSISPDQLISEVDDGLIIYFLQGAHSSNPVSGEFSVVATPAWVIRKGEIVHSTRGVMLAGNMFEVLKNVSAIANNDRKMGQLVSPWVQVENVRVIGQ
jgi:PmbA protein